MSLSDAFRTMAPALAVLLVASACAGPQSDASYDVVIRGGTVFDGTGAPPVEADVAIRGDRIVAVGEVEGEADRTIDATGLYVTPGFIDAHSHSDDTRLVDGRGPSFAFQGITTEIYGETTSKGPVGGMREGPELPEGVERDWETLGGFLESLERRGTAANFGSYVGTGGLRAYVMGYEDRPPTDDELDEMRRLVREAMEQGALGISSGMSYVPNVYMSTDELVALAEVAVEEGGIYATHARTDTGRDPDAIREAIDIAERTGIPVHFFHFNFTASVSASEFLSIVEDARADGHEITGDSYTYTRGITPLRAYLPAWAQEGGTEAMLERLRDPETRRRIAEGIDTDEPALVARVGWDRVWLGVEDPEVRGKRVTEVAEERGVTPEVAFMDVVLENEGRGMVIDWNNEEETLRQVLAAPYVVGGTDGSAQNLDNEEALPPILHPRHFGTFPRLLGTYVRDEGLLTWPEAIHKLTGRTAEVVGLEDRGTLEPGKAADVVVLDPETLDGVATFDDPFHYAEGVLHVLVNGVAVVEEGEMTGALPGRALRGPGYQGGEAGSASSAEDGP